MSFLLGLLIGALVGATFLWGFVFKFVGKHADLDRRLDLIEKVTRLLSVDVTREDINEEF